MKYLAAYLLLKLGGAEEVTAEDIRKVVSASGAEVDDERVTALLDAVNGRSDRRSGHGGSLQDGVCCWCRCSGSSGSSWGHGWRQQVVIKQPRRKQAKGAAKEEPKEESDEDLGFGLFD
ncbi:hypothetical protein F1559_001695 [Cyanidiococcus yangmingshanensis]|uniref:60S acidic ribosomal protein P2 n=1 Tax=Cyanidiococcus yangmingshanensis TaxID=2690220 RepID=A0A7J7IDU1_9RHOD|nr:hypothetical protein F1559_001695 [Cyanidiococcus yangmingshanensis]